MEIKAIASRLVRNHGTRDPFRIAAALGFIIIDTPLDGIRGYYQYIHRCHIIYLNNDLSEQERCWVCAHELGHAFLHKGLNRIFMDKHTHMATNRYEREADRFAADLLYSDEFLQDFVGCSYITVAENLGMSNEVAEYRMSTVYP
jgi:Zn-dependent peptidase ImmA (M78 family)